MIDPIPELSDLIADAPVSLTLTGPRSQDEPVLAVNPAFTRLTGYAHHDLVGKNLRVLQEPDDEGPARQRMRRDMRDLGRTDAIVTNRRRSGRSRDILLLVRPVLLSNLESLNLALQSPWLGTPGHEADDLEIGADGTVRRIDGGPLPVGANRTLDMHRVLFRSYLRVMSHSVGRLPDAPGI